MVSLKDCNYKEFLDTQPVDKSYLEELREKIATGDSESEKLFKRQIYSLAAYIAQKYICEYIDVDYLFSHIYLYNQINRKVTSNEFFERL